jgi:Protein of unknown function (DUF1524)
VTISRRATVAIASAILAAMTTGCAAGPTEPSRSIESTSPQSEAPATNSRTVIASGPVPLSDLLAELVIAPEHLDGYDRDLFPLWIDADGDGCNTRYEVLIAEAVVAPTISGICKLTGGSWVSPYDGLRIDDAKDVQIDHLVALAEAWYSGAFRWTTERRERYANDLDVPWTLNAVSAKANEEKGSSDPAEWLPPLSSDLCPYIEGWIATKVRWSLSVDATEKGALDQAIAECPDAAIEVPAATP